MEKAMSRPKNETLGRPLRDKRVPLQLTQDEHAELSEAAERQGMPLSTFMRWASLKVARDE